MKFKNLEITTSEAEKELDKLPEGTIDKGIEGKCYLRGGKFERDFGPSALYLYIFEGLYDVRAPEGSTDFYVIFPAPRHASFNYGGMNYVFLDYNLEDREKFKE